MYTVEKILCSSVLATCNWIPSQDLILDLGSQMSMALSVGVLVFLMILLSLILWVTSVILWIIMGVQQSSKSLILE